MTRDVHDTIQLRLILLGTQGQVDSVLYEQIRAMPNSVVVGNATQAADVLIQSHRSRADVLLLLTDWSEHTTLDTIQMLDTQLPDVPIVVINLRPVPLRIAAVMVAGARGYISAAGIDDLPYVVRLAARGGFGCCAASHRELSVRLGVHQSLSPRERQIAAQIAAGQTNTEIAELFALKPSTIDTHVKRISRKINGRTRTDIATWWQRQIVEGEAGVQQMSDSE